MFSDTIVTCPSAATSSLESNSTNRVAAAKKVATFEDFKRSKGKQWKSLVSKSASKTSKAQESDVTITIGLFEWHPKKEKLNPKRGKRMALVVSNADPYAHLLEKATSKWKSFHSDCFDAEEDCMLLLENYKEALFLPGSCQEFFSLKRYREELGKDYNKITLYLCTRSDYGKCEGDEEESEDIRRESLCPSLPGTSGTKMHTLEEYFNADDNSDTVVHFTPSDAKKPKHDLSEDSSNCNAAEVATQISSDEVLAKEMQLELDSHPVIELDDDHKESGKLDLSKYVDLPTLIKYLEEHIDKAGQFFLVIRRGITFQRLLSLWQRERKKTSPEKVLRVKYVGENGIDSGAMSKECLAKAIPELGTTMFPNGAPVDSVYNIQNGKFRSAGELVATSVVQGGPPPRFLHENVFKMLVTPSVDIANLNPKEHLTESDQQLLSRVKDDVNAYQDIITDNGYTGF